MKVKDLIKELQKTGEENEVRLIAGAYGNDYTEDLYISFDDLGDILIYELPEDKKKEMSDKEYQDLMRENEEQNRGDTI